MPNSDQSDEVHKRCLDILKETGVSEKVLWLVEVQPLETFAKTFFRMPEEVPSGVEAKGHDFVRTTTRVVG